MVGNWTICLQSRALEGVDVVFEIQTTPNFPGLNSQITENSTERTEVGTLFLIIQLDKGRNDVM